MKRSLFRFLSLCLVLFLFSPFSVRASSVDLLTLYARWQTQVTFDANGGVLAGGATDAERALAGRSSGSITYTVNQTASTGLIGNRSGYTFVQWNTSPDGSGINILDYGPVTGPVTFHAVYYKSDYPYTGSVQTFTVPIDGWYRIQCWGASGGGYRTVPSGAGFGGYAVSEFWLEAGTVMQVYVGGQGYTKTGGFNGGGGSHDPNGQGGGGATDVRLSAALGDRIIVAGGGGGSDNPNGDGGRGGDGGGLIGGNASLGSGDGRGATQTSGFALGQGQAGCYLDGGGAGGGYWGGWGATHNNGCGGGGSGYISGYPGCVNHYSGVIGRNCEMIMGNSVMPNWNGGNMTGVYGNGYARIALVSTTR